MKISLFIPCFVDACFPQVGISMIRVLERLGHQVDYPEEFTCCGQPAFNSGYWDEARSVAEKVLGMYRHAEVIVSVSGSCGAMAKNFYLDLFRNTPQEADARAMSAKVWEFTDFLVNKLGVTDVGARFPAKVTIHDGCHGLRELGVKHQPRALLAKVRDLHVVEMSAAESCCGFGGTFSVKFPMISSAMGEVKCASALETGADYVVSCDSSCLMHIQGLADRQKKPIRTMHVAEVLART